ncbi:ribose-phosphate diphosphokinase [Brucella haematophila]|nr:ribose-phosphate diphosphokinase [Brucella haematophila]
MKLVTGNSNRPLAEAVAAHLNLELTHCTVTRFADQEVHVQLHDNVRGEDVYIIQSTSTPADGHLMELLIMTDALRRSSARRITAVIPYFGYARQDRRTIGRTPISAKLVANMITGAGVNRVITVDLHTDQIQGFFDIPTDNLYSAPVMTLDIEARFRAKSAVVISPDVGGVSRARAIAKRTGTGSVAKNRLIAERTPNIFSEAVHERFQVASFSERNYSLGCPLVLPLWDQLPGY